MKEREIERYRAFIILSNDLKKKKKKKKKHSLFVTKPVPGSIGRVPISDHHASTIYQRRVNSSRGVSEESLANQHT